MHGKRKPTIVLVVLAVLALAVAACGDDDGDGTAATGQATTETAAQTLTLTGEETTLALAAGTARVLEENDVAVAPLDPATAGDEGIAFPITGGEVEADSLAGTIEHSGGLTFSAGRTEVELTDFVVDTTAGTLTATTPDGAQLTTLNLDLSAIEREDAADGTIVVRGISATLTDDAARALNDAFSVELFEGGLPIGDVTVRATAG